MKKYLLIMFSVLLNGVVVCAQVCDIQSFVSGVNQNWQATNYPAIYALVTNRLATCTNDVMALGVKYAYYLWADVDFTNAQLSARTLVGVVSNQASSEVNQPWAFMAQAKAMAEMLPPDPFPTNQARSTAQIAYLHEREFPTNFPDIDLLNELVVRISDPP